MARRVYLDANADAPVLPRAWQAYLETVNQFAEPELPEALQRLAQTRYARDLGRVATALGCEPGEVYITSGGTEADAQALLGLCGAGDHVVTTSIEHAAVSKTLLGRAERDGIRVTVVPVSRRGVVDVGDMAAAITSQTRLVSCVLACNETGVLQPVPELAEICAGRGVLLHTDAVQALGKVPVQWGALGVHAMSLSGHKMGAVGGVGALLVKGDVGFSGLPLRDHDNLPGLASFAAALADLPSQAQNDATAALRDAFEAQVVTRLVDAEIMGRDAVRLPNTSCLHLPGCEGDGLVMALDLKGFSISTGSACSSGSVDPSPILLGMGLTRAQAKSTVRISLTRTTTQDEVERAAAALIEVALKMRG